MPKLSTHVLDTAHGRPAAGVAIQLYHCEAPSRRPIGSFVTNADGRCDAPLLAGEALQVGIYELDFAIGDYFAGLGVAQSEPRRRFARRVTGDAGPAPRSGGSGPYRGQHSGLRSSPGRP